ncbi:magnesium transporter MRS2-10 isoform X2 [Cryptomeria japonica]|uniref:magnesium transporter MRS2-10 isoform X2 n=2 Tax=Cryptomeria japonica TaxID=3369 RepID=UPI0027DA360A|nr:magnesium transporter MRS2-10 isoform X2 [Cryptomeria japonica]
MAGVKEPFLPLKPVGAAPRTVFQGSEVLGLKKRGQGVKSWIRVGTNAISEHLDADKFAIMKRCGLPARDLRVLDPVFDYPSTILGRGKAIVVNLEQIRCIITADEVLLLNCLDIYVLKYVAELQRRLAVRNSLANNMRQSRPRSSRQEDKVDVTTGTEPQTNKLGSDNLTDYFSSSSADNLPFEFRALEVALDAVCTYLDTQAMELEIEAYPLLDELTSKISTLNLEHARRLKSRLVALTRRVQKVRDKIEQLMDDDEGLAGMCLTEKKERSEEKTEECMEDALYRAQSLQSYIPLGAGCSVSDPVFPLHSRDESQKHEEQLSWEHIRHESTDGDQKMEKKFNFACSRYESTNGDQEDIEELEMLLEAYFVVIDSTLNKLTSLKEYIDDTEDFINIQLDNVRNQLIQFELLLSIATFVVTIFSFVAAMFGTNFAIGIFEQPHAFKFCRNFLCGNFCRFWILGIECRFLEYILACLYEMTVPHCNLHAVLAFEAES